MQIMNQYGVHNEVEVVSGCISKFAKHRRKKGDIKQLVMEAAHALRKKFLKCAMLHVIQFVSSMSCMYLIRPHEF